ncbi:thioesterase [Planomonospora sp. ID82291]|uniref:thioesterase n=1 Tax=Planomonospora sp. ID82291 TaxID=2738136 RepID=UPI0018C3558F|nr:thioesterase [Planomonospora sp. ID82291]MBG0816413.1 thioesterase [Planomonospora sp. ID82291]
MATGHPPQSTHESPPTLFCLPYAGGGASAYQSMRAALSGTAEVVALNLPGREGRIAEPPRVSIGEIADEMAPATGRPYAVYGHSMGARIAFEVVRELRRRALPMPVRLYVGGAHPPDRRVPLAAAVGLADEAFIEQLVRRAGALTELRDVPELRELLLPLLRSDFTWIKEYRYAPEPPLDVPLVAFAGLDDAEVPAPVMLGWSRHTRSRFRLRTVRGGHLFLADAHADLPRLIAEDLAAGDPAGGRAEGPPGAAPPAEDEVHVWLAARETSPGRLVEEVLRRYGTARRSLRHGADRHDGLALAAVSRDCAVGVAVERLRVPGVPGDAFDDALLHADEREQIEDAAEEDRPWLALRARTAKRALAEGSGAAPDRIGFADLTAPGPWRPFAHRVPGPPPPDRDTRAAGVADPVPPPGDGPPVPDLTGWQVVHLPLRVPRGEAVAAVALPRDRMRLRFDTLTDGLR